MGCDGGTICDSREFIVKTKKSAFKLDKKTESKLHWTLCRLSKQALNPSHLVACKIGFLYNKDALLQYLLDVKQKKRQPLPILEHIKSISKDVCNVHVTLNSDFNEATDDPNEKPRFACPITRKPIQYGARYYLMRKCGHVISEDAIQTLLPTGSSNNNNTALQTCLHCNGSNDDTSKDVTLLNPPEDVEAALREELLGASSSKKSQGKKHKREEAKQQENGDNNDASTTKADGAEESPPKAKKSKKQKHQATVPATAPITTMPAASAAAAAAEKSMFKNATPEVWKSLFIDSSQRNNEPLKNGNDFLARSLNYLVNTNNK